MGVYMHIYTHKYTELYIMSCTWEDIRRYKWTYFHKMMRDWKENEINPYNIFQIYDNFTS